MDGPCVFLTHHISTNRLLEERVRGFSSGEEEGSLGFVSVGLV